MSDDAIGRKVKPKRYAGQDRETIDRQRDLFRTVFVGLAVDEIPGATLEQVYRVADVAFSIHCQATALKYSDRMGRKGEDVDQERAKRDWYEQMGAHVLVGTLPDPRSERPDFEPYSPTHPAADWMP